MDNNHTHDALDRILFDTAKQLTADMQLNSAWAQIQATHRRGRRRKALRRYTPLAATLIVGLGLGLLLSPVLLPKSASTAADSALQQAPAESGDPASEPETVIVEGPNGPEDYIVIDPPKTSGPGVEEATPGELRTFPHLSGQSDIRALLPAWLPEGMETITIELPDNTWYSSAPNADSYGYAALRALITDAPVPNVLWGEDFPPLEIGEGIPYYLRMEGEAEASWCEWHIRLAEDCYLLLTSEYVPFADVEKALEHMGKAKQE